MQEVYKLKGAAPLKNLLGSQFRNLQQNKYHRGISIQLPVYLFCLDAGWGRTTCLRHLARYLRESKMVPFSGSEDVVEWTLDGDAFETDGSFDGLLNALDAPAGLTDHFRGVVGVDACSLTGHLKPDHKRRLIEFLKDKRNHSVIVLFIREEQEAFWRRELAPWLHTECLRFLRPEPAELAVHILDAITRHDLTCHPEYPTAALKEAAAKLLREKTFRGYAAIDEIVRETIYHVSSASRLKNAAIPQEALLSVIEGHLRSIHLADHHQKIGFCIGRE